MHHLRSPLAVSIAAMLAMSLGLSGCAPTTGTVTVEVRFVSTAETDMTLKVTIRDAANKVVARQTMRSGESAAFAGIPFGEVSITAQGLCVVIATLTESGLRAIFEPLHCTI